MRERWTLTAISLFAALFCSGCALITAADAAVIVVATTVQAGATIVEMTIDVAAGGVKAVAGRFDDKKSAQ